MFQDATNVTDDVATDVRSAAGNNLCGWTLPWSALWQVVKLSPLPVGHNLYILKCLGEKRRLWSGYCRKLVSQGVSETVLLK